MPSGSIAERKPHPTQRHQTYVGPDMVLIQRADIDIFDHRARGYGLLEHTISQYLNRIGIAVRRDTATKLQG